MKRICLKGMEEIPINCNECGLRYSTHSYWDDEDTFYCGVAHWELSENDLKYKADACPLEEVEVVEEKSGGEEEKTFSILEPLYTPVVKELKQHCDTSMPKLLFAINEKGIKKEDIYQIFPETRDSYPFVLYWAEKKGE